MSRLNDFLLREIEAAGLNGELDPLSQKVVTGLYEMVKAVGAVDHDGQSLTGTLRMFDRIVNYKPLSPLTGEDSEWIDGDTSDIQINVRCPTVTRLKDEEGNTVVVDLGMKPVYVFPNGRAVVRPEDKAPVVSFPYYPGLPFTVAVDEAGNVIGG